MPEVICDTSPLQYLHQLGLLHLLPDLVTQITVPLAVADELSVGNRLGLDVPDVYSLSWVAVRSPVSAHLPITAAGLGPGETEVLLLALEAAASAAGAIVILDDARARSFAEQLGLNLTGTLGVLLDAKRVGLIPEITPSIDRLQSLGFRLSRQTRAAIINLAGELP